jgi:hypothetical protein
MEVPMATRSKARPRQKRSSSEAGAGGEGGGSTAPLTYRDIAWWAETADGSRDQDLVIAEVMENGSVKKVVKKSDDAKAQRQRIVVDGIRTESKVKGRPAPTRVTIEVAGEEIECKAKDGVWCDSVFCTESAMEKFLFPYYRSQRLLTDAEWAKLEATFLSRSTVAIGHVHPSNTEAFVAGSHAAGSFYRLQVKPAKGGARAEVTWESII